MDEAKSLAAAVSGDRCPSCGARWKIIRILREEDLETACRTCAKLRCAYYGPDQITTVVIRRTPSREERQNRRAESEAHPCPSIR